MQGHIKKHRNDPEYRATKQVPGMDVPEEIIQRLCAGVGEDDL